MGDIMNPGFMSASVSLDTVARPFFNARIATKDIDDATGAIILQAGADAKQAAQRGAASSRQPEPLGRTRP